MLLSEADIELIIKEFITDSNQFELSEDGMNLECGEWCTGCAFGVYVNDEVDFDCAKSKLMPRIREAAPWKFL